MTRDPIIATAIRADSATSDAEGRAQAAEMVTAATFALLAETVTRLNASEDRALRLDRDLIEANRSRNIAVTDLNATRLALTTAEAFRDSLQAEADGLRSELTSMTIMRDKAHAAHEQAVADWSARGDRLIGLCHALGCPNDQQSCLDAIAALRAELRARPVLTVECLAAAIRSQWSVEQVSACGELTIAAALMLHLGAVTLPSQDAATAIVAKMQSYGWWCASDSGDGRCESDMTRALASLGAPATTPSKPADAATVESVARAIWCAYNNAEATGWSNMTVGVRAMWMAAARAGIAASKPADVFAGVSIDDLARAYELSGDGTSAALHPTICDWNGIRAVLDALRVKLVTEEHLADVLAALPVWRGERMPWQYGGARAWASDLLVRLSGIPVTPEAGK